MVSATSAMKLSLKSYESATSKEQRLQMRPLFRAPPALTEFTKPAEIPKSVTIHIETPPCSASNICFGDARVFSGQEQFLTSYSKTYSVYTPRDALYTSPCQSHKNARPAAPSPVQDLMFRFAQKIAASRVEPGGKGGRGGKSSLRRAFESMDINGDRRISIAELQIAIGRFGFNPQQDVINSMFKLMAAENKDFIDYMSFCAAVEGVPENLRASW